MAKNPTTPLLLRQLVLGTGLLLAADVFAEQPEQVIQPEIDRREIHVPKIDTEDVEIGIYGGTLSVEDFGAESVTGGRLTYHVTEDFFIEGVTARSAVSDDSFRRFGIPILRQREVDLTFYYLSIGVNLFPGEVFIGKKWAMTSAVYLAGGVGNVNFNDEDHNAFNFGIGIRLLPTDWLAIRAEMRGHLFESDILGKNELKQNFEFSLGLSVYF
jgi:outer membrane beta-barrel protein